MKVTEENVPQSERENTEKPAVKKSNLLSRYISILDLLYMLEEDSLLLSNAESWSDKEDKKFLKQYAEGETVQALCFFMGNEKSQHWELYGKYGCKIEFDKERMLDKIPKIFKHKKVRYIKLGESEKNKEELPFVKQWRFRDEEEYRFVWKGKEKSGKKIPLPINPESIRKIIISGNIKKELATNLRKIILKKCEEKKLNEVKVYHSRLFR